ncbi:MAG: alanine--tRNA ligase [Candidatus Yonathbacteria bacterium]|nr:alanine--tRNA ligase [Candidatus Yonathbacteria bacterium]
MLSRDIRTTFLTFFEKRGHTIVPSAPLVPENDPSVLFNTAGMQPLVPYLMGQPYPTGAKRIVNVQKCVRTQDIEEVGDKTHDTFFEMLGNWSLGDYFKDDAIAWSHALLTSKEEGFGLDPARLYVTVFAGNADAPRDDEAAAIWKKLGVPEHRIYFLEDNWWSPGDNGPCGPDSEMFYDITLEGLGDMTLEEFKAADDAQKVVEIWNDVFMEYEKKDGKVIGKLAQKNVDTGAGLERLAMALQGTDSIFTTDLFDSIVAAVHERASSSDVRAERIVADHIRTAVFLIADGVRPGNTDQGYILRRLLRRAVRYADVLGFEVGGLATVAEAAAVEYTGVYPNVIAQKDVILDEVRKEEEKFRVTLAQGMREFEKIATHVTEKGISGVEAFTLFSSYGFPLEMTKELAGERSLLVDETGYAEEMEKHRATSRIGAEQKFKGGLADTSEKTTALHTATHLLLAGLRKELGDHVHQAGSNITEERLRFDFTHPEKVERDVLDRIEAFVNGVIAANVEVRMEEMPKEAAKTAGVEGSFWEKYPETVRVYSVIGEDGTVYSRELCGGPHVARTGDLGGVFKIQKEESSSAGVRRIKAVLS